MVHVEGSEILVLGTMTSFVRKLLATKYYS